MCRCACTASRIYIRSFFKNRLFTDNTLLEAKRQALRLKRHYSWWLKWMATPFLVIFVAWIAHDMCQSYEGLHLKIMLASMAFGLIVGLIVGLWQNWKVQRTANEILQQIEELEEE